MNDGTAASTEAAVAGKRESEEAAAGKRPADVSSDGASANDYDDRPSDCHPRQFRCLSGQCIADNYRCDLQYDCRDGSDEEPSMCRPVLQPFPYPTRQPISHGNSGSGGGGGKKVIQELHPKKGVDLRMYDTPQMQVEGDDVVFRCRDEGETRLPVKWSRVDGKLLSNRHKEQEGRLTLYDVTLDDAGIYRCTVIGSNPLVAATAHLTVLQQDNRLQELKRASVKDDMECPPREDVCQAFRQLQPLFDQRRVPRDNYLRKLCRE